MRKTRDRVATVLLATVALSTLSGLFALPAFAYCADEYTSFVEGTSAREFTNGTRQDIIWTNRALDADCEAFAGSTAHVSKEHVNDPDSRLVEVGWRKYDDCPGTVDYCFFTEKCSNSNPCVVNEYSISATPGFGTFDLFRVANRPESGGQTDWYLEVDRDHDGVFTTLIVFHTDWHRGFVNGESFAFGNDTSLYTEQKALSFKNNSDSWVSWPNNDCLYINLAGWKYTHVSNTEFKISQGSPSNC